MQFWLAVTDVSKHGRGFICRVNQGEARIIIIIIIIIISISICPFINIYMKSDPVITT
jgi:hypothetical protein